MQKQDVYETFKYAGRNKIGDAFQDGTLTEQEARTLLARNTEFTYKQILLTIKGWK